MDTAALPTLTAADIRDAARETNREFPEAMPLIETGTPEILVTVLAADRQERTYRVVAAPGIRATYEGREITIGAGDPVVVASGVRPRWGNVTRLVCAQRCYGWSVRGAQVPVRWVAR
jgi:hypothetical protein